MSSQDESGLINQQDDVHQGNKVDVQDNCTPDSLVVHTFHKIALMQGTGNAPTPDKEFKKSNAAKIMCCSGSKCTVSHCSSLALFLSFDRHQ